MATNISVLQPSGEIQAFEVMPETTCRALKQQIKERKAWDKLTLSWPMMQRYWTLELLKILLRVLSSNQML